MSAENRIELAQPGDLIIYSSDFDTAWHVGRLVSVSAMMFRVEPWDRNWYDKTDPYYWSKPVQMSKGKYRRRIPAEVWKGDDAFVEKLRVALLDRSNAHSDAHRALLEEYLRDRDALLDRMGAVPK